MPTHWKQPQTHQIQINKINQLRKKLTPGLIKTSKKDANCMHWMMPDKTLLLTFQHKEAALKPDSPVFAAQVDAPNKVINQEQARNQLKLIQQQRAHRPALRQAHPLRPEQVQQQLPRAQQHQAAHQVHHLKPEPEPREIKNNVDYEKYYLLSF